MYDIINKLPQPIPLTINNETKILKPYGRETTEILTSQINNLIKSNCIKVKERK